jgi:hypothetical protein
MQKVLVVNTDGSVITVNDDLTLQFLQDVVGGWVQVVGLPRESNETETVAMWVNEEGKFSNLERNDVATYLWARSYGLTDTIMGNVVLTGGTDEDGETLGLSDEMITHLMEQIPVDATPDLR